MDLPPVSSLDARPLRLETPEFHPMPLRPFPYQLGIGTDIVHVPRIRAILKKAEGKPDHLDRFLRRFLLPLERHEFYKFRDRLAENQLDATSKHLAGRWAAKEAVIKAVSWRRLSFHDVMIRRSQRNNSVIAVILDEGVAYRCTNGEQQESRDANEGRTEASASDNEAEINGQIAKISISHDSDYSTAMCIAAEEPARGDVGGEAAARELF